MLAALPAARLLSKNLDALTLASDTAVEFPLNFLLLVLHLAGLFALSRYFQLPWIYAAILLSALGLVLAGLARLRISVAWLAPFFFVYLVLAVRFFWIRVLGGTVGGYFDYQPPEWGLPFLQIEPVAVAACVYSSLSLCSILVHSRRRAVLLFAASILALTLVWAVAAYFGHRTHGATGSDPYAYVQMAVDFATRGTFAHRFELFPDFAPLKIQWYPMMHVGYHLPMNSAGDAVTVWPPGGALAFALAFLGFGEAAFYWINPVFTLLCVIEAGFLAWELSAVESPRLRAIVAVVTAALVATSSTQVVWAGVTMVDSQAELFSIFALNRALCARNQSNLRQAFWSGLALGAAYDIRHTQIVLALSLLVILGSQKSLRVRSLFWSALGAILVALPDLWYHQLYLGSWLRPESEELALFSVSAIADTANRLYGQLFAASEFGWLVPFLIFGAFQLGRRARSEFWALAAWIGLSLALHLPYTALRLRDLLPEFPALAFLGAYGAALLISQLLKSRRLWAEAAGGLILLAALDLFALRAWNTIPQVWEPARPIFGYMTESQRAALDELEELTPPEAVIGSTLNDGAIELYARRNTFRPEVWNETDRREFVQLMFGKHRTVYVLEDGPAIDGVRIELGRAFQVEQVATLDVPMFGDGPADNPGALWKIEAK